MPTVSTSISRTRLTGETRDAELFVQWLLEAGFTEQYYGDKSFMDGLLTQLFVEASMTT